MYSSMSDLKACKLFRQIHNKNNMLELAAEELFCFGSSIMSALWGIPYPPNSPDLHHINEDSGVPLRCNLIGKELNLIGMELD